MSRTVKYQIHSRYEERLKYVLKIGYVKGLLQLPFFTKRTEFEEMIGKNKVDKWQLYMAFLFDFLILKDITDSGDDETKLLVINANIRDERWIVIDYQKFASKTYLKSLEDRILESVNYHFNSVEHYYSWYNTSDEDTKLSSTIDTFLIQFLQKKGVWKKYGEIKHKKTADS